MIKRALLSLGLLLIPSLAFSQATVLQGGSYVAGHQPMYSTTGGSQPIIQDSGSAAGGGVGVGISELLQVNRAGNGDNTAPYANNGTGQLNTHNCSYDAPTTNATGYHWYCWDVNSQGSSILAIGAGGGASPLDFIININGTPINIATDFPTIPVTVPNGGTGLTSITAHNLIVGNGISNVTLLAPSATSGMALTSQGSSSDPAYGVVAITGGGTGQTTATAGLTALLPSQTGQNGKVLATDGSVAAWTNIPGTGTVTSITFSDGLTATVNPCVASCTASLADIADDRIMANISGGSDVPSATTLTALLDATAGNGQGSIVTRQTSAWTALAAGTNGYALLSQGSGSDLVWGQYLINNLAIASQAQGDLTYYNGANWTRLGAATAGNVLVTGGASANPAWASNFTAGFTTTAFNLGTATTGTITPAPANGNFQRLINGGAFTLACPSATGDYTLVVQITNNGSAGTISNSGCTLLDGSAFSTVNGDDFMVYFTKLNGFTYASVKALQ